MSSTDLDTPPLKSILIAILVVLGLHVFTAVALVAMKPSAPKNPLPKQTPPIEIAMVSLPAPLPKETVKVAKPVEKQADKVAIEKTPSLPKPQPATPSKAVAEQPKKPVMQEKKPDIVPVIKKENPLQKQIQQEEPHHAVEQAIPEPQAKNPQAEQRRIVAAQAEKAAQELARQAALDAQIKANAKVANEAAQKAAAEAAQKQAAAAARAREAAASNEPVNFTASNANWASAPNFSFPERAARRAQSGDTLNVVLILRVNKQGGIDTVRIAQSSGNAALDKEAARQVRSGKFKPFMKNGMPVVGNVTLPIAYSVP